MSGGASPKQSQKPKDGNKRLGSLNSGFLSQSNRPGGLRSTGSGEPSTSQPSTSQPEQPVPNGQPAPKKRFIPKIRSRSETKGQTAAAAGVSGAAGDDQFKELIKQAQSDRRWERGGGRGRGSAAASNAQPAPKVMLNAGSVGDPRGVSGLRAPGPSIGGGGGGGRSGDKPSAARSRLGTGVKQEIIYDEDKDADEEPEGLAQPMLDYRQYYPTVLPMRPPGHDVGEADGDLLEDSKPPDLAHLLEDEVNVAESLGLGEEGSGEEHVVLLQMPDLLPSPAPPPAVDAAAAKLRHLRREDAPPAPVALSLKDLPSGKIGKMLVYESGAVKMQLGDVLFDVLPGTEAAFRQDIAAVSAADQACVFLGGVQQRVVACPDIGHLLSNEKVMGLQTNGMRPEEQLDKGTKSAKPMEIDVKPEEGS
ncbi:hypothetical protein WJX75_000773 [Coccomyxa subellipsoidea]|uniref:DNA-directed RNA polymerase III subunit RPC4 n=1 Tax=Coccomyxa subellipsoidea TaxID=248742 RepID=A0ABR2YTG4_9CHLO